MPSFDISNKIDLQKIDNAIQTAKKELLTRYDLKDEACVIEFDKKDKKLALEAKQEMALSSMVDIILSKFSKQALDVRSLDLTKKPVASGKILTQNIQLKEGIDKEQAKKIVNFIKNSGVKVQGAIHDDQIRVNGKKIDDLQTVIGLLRQEDFDLPLQFDNFRS
jgi:uncharacterized protein YajQ (UPF0234 family)